MKAILFFLIPLLLACNGRKKLNEVRVDTREQVVLSDSSYRMQSGSLRLVNGRAESYAEIFPEGSFSMSEQGYTGQARMVRVYQSRRQQELQLDSLKSDGGKQRFSSTTAYASKEVSSKEPRLKWEYALASFGLVILTLGGFFLKRKFSRVY